MARQQNTEFTGTTGNLIFYQWRDIYAVRTKPVVVKQTKATIQQAGLFGVASHAGAVLRRLLKPGLPNAKDRRMMRRFEQAIVQWLRIKATDSGAPQTSLPFITGFEFNEQSLLKQLFTPVITVETTNTGTLRLLIPPLNPVKDIKAPANTLHINVICRLAMCSLVNNNTLNSTATQFTIHYTDTHLPGHTVELPLTIGKNCLAVVLLALEYTVTKYGVAQVLKDERWLPVGVVGSVGG